MTTTWMVASRSWGYDADKKYDAAGAGSGSLGSGGGSIASSGRGSSLFNGASNNRSVHRGGVGTTLLGGGRRKAAGGMMGVGYYGTSDVGGGGGGGGLHWRGDMEKFDV